MADWDAESDQLHSNLTTTYRAARDAARARARPDAALARGWHGAIMAGLDVPGPAFVATFRGEPGLEGCDVEVAGLPGAASTQVAAELRGFETTLQRAVTALDDLIPTGTAPADRDHLNAVIELAAWTHAEWVRIHPFFNGNGRIARLWAGYIAMRYGVPPFVRLRPRPDGGYGAACAAAMAGTWLPTAQVFRRMYLEMMDAAGAAAPSHDP